MTETVRLSSEVIQIIDTLKQQFRCESREEALSKALKIAGVVAHTQDEDGVISLVNGYEVFRIKVSELADGQ